MANTRSANKRNRQAVKRRSRNRAASSTLRTAIRKVRRSVEENDQESAEKLLVETLRLIDRTASRGVVHRNAAARHKSRLVRLVRTSTA